MDLTRRTPPAPGTMVIRSPWGRLGVGLAVALFGGGTVSAARSGAPGDVLATGLVLATVLCLAVLLWWVPCVVLDDEGVTITNPFTTTRIGWGAVQGASSRLGLSVTSTRGTHHAWAAPARSTARAEDRHAAVPTGRVTGTFDLDAWQVARLVEKRLEQGVTPAGDAVHVRWAWERIGALGALVAVAALVLLR